MARRGRFGQAPRVQSSMTSTIIAIAREMENQRTSDVFDAWKNGGMFEGAPMTDERLLAFIREKRDGLSPKDPSWDQWNSSLIQYTFSIEESKHNLAYQQGKLSAGAFANWYKGQLGGIAKNSEWYRTVAGRAAQWAKAAIAAAHAGARRRAGAAYDAKLAEAGKAQETFAAVTAGLRNWAEANGYIQPGQDITEVMNVNVGAFDNALAALNFKVNGHVLTVAYWQSLGRAAMTGAQTVIDLKIKAGRSVTADIKAKGKLAVQIGNIGSFPTRAQYEILRENYKQAIDNAQGNVLLINQINSDYAQQLSDMRTRLGREPEATRDNGFMGGLAHEINAIVTGQVTGPTPDDMYNTTANNASKGQADAESTAKSALANQLNTQALAAGLVYYGQDPSWQDHTKPGGEFGYWPIVADSVTGGKSLDQAQAVVEIGGQATVVTLTPEVTPAYQIVSRSDGQAVNWADLTPEQQAALSAGSSTEYQYSPAGGQTGVGSTFIIPGALGLPAKTLYGVQTTDPATGAKHTVYTWTDPYTQENPHTGAVPGKDGRGVVVDKDGVTIAGHPNLSKPGDTVPQGGDGRFDPQNPTGGGLGAMVLPTGTPVNSLGYDVSYEVPFDPEMPNSQLNAIADTYDAQGNHQAATEMRGVVGKKTLLTRVGEAAMPENYKPPRPGTARTTTTTPGRTVPGATLAGKGGSVTLPQTDINPVTQTQYDSPAGPIVEDPLHPGVYVPVAGYGAPTPGQVGPVKPVGPPAAPSSRAGDRAGYGAPQTPAIKPPTAPPSAPPAPVAPITIPNSTHLPPSDPFNLRRVGEAPMPTIKLPQNPRAL